MDFFLRTAIPFLLPASVACVIVLLRGQRISLRPLLLATLVYLIYWLSLTNIMGLISVPNFLLDTENNWLGKLLSICASLALIAALPEVNFQSVGITFKQKAGSLTPALIATIFMLAGVFTADYFIQDIPNTNLENLIFQAGLPGIDEEIFFRGLFLLLLHQAFGRQWSILGIQFGWGAVIASASFAIIHGFAVSNGAVVVNIGAILYTGMAGLTFLWLRERTGSLILPIVAHNLMNLGLAIM